MKILPSVLLLLTLAPLVHAQTPALDPCALIPKADLVRIMGEIKEGPKAREGLMKEKQCEWTNMSGSWLVLGISSAEGWEMRKRMANEPVDIAGLGEEAFSSKRGTDAELCVRKGKWMLEIRTSSGAPVARKIAEVAVKKLP